MRTFIQDLRYSFRMLLRAPGFAVLVTVILALGVGANSTVFSIVNAVLLRPLPFHNPDELYQLDEVDPKGQAAGMAPADLEDVLHYDHAFAEGAISRWYNATLTGREGAENLFGACVSTQMFSMLDVHPAIGRLFRPDEFQPGAAGAVLLSDRLWTRRYGKNPAVIGTTLMMGGKAYSIAGVMPADFYLSQRFEFYIPWQMNGEDRGKRDVRWPTLVRLAQGMSASQARPALEVVYRNIAPEDVRRGWRIRLTPIHEQITARIRPALLVVLGAVGFVLLIACCNIACLLLARGAERTREMAIRGAVGAGRGRVFRQLLTESVLLALIGSVAGTSLGALGVRVLVHSFEGHITLPRLDQARMDWRVLLFTVAVTGMTGILFGLSPAWNGSRSAVGETLRQGGLHGGQKSQLLRHALVIAETALSMVLLVGAGLMLRSFVRLIYIEPGFKADRVLTVRLPLPTTINEPSKQAPYFTRIIEHIQDVPGLEAAGLIAPLPLSGVEATAKFFVEGRPAPAGETELVKLRSASPGYFRAMGLTLQQGRVFNESDDQASPAITVVSDTLARRYFPNENPIGKRVSISREGPWMTIAGIVNDVKSINLTDKGEPQLYRDYRQFFFAPFANTIVVRTRAADPISIASSVQRQIRLANPDQPIADVAAMRNVVSDSIAQPRFYTLLLSIFAAVSLLLTATGLYGVLSFSVNHRVREIGVRVALGATRRNILYDVLGRAMILVAAGVGMGLLGALALTRLLQAQLYEVTPTDPATYTVVSLLLSTVGLVASYVPAQRAMRMDPNMALRHE